MENILYIRVDGNEQIGTGHIMRCLAIAETLRRNKTDVVFIVADTRSESLILNKGFKTICLNTIWNKLDSEIEIIAQILVHMSTEKSVNRSLKIRSLLTWFGTCRIPSAGAVTT